LSVGARPGALVTAPQATDEQPARA